MMANFTLGNHQLVLAGQRHQHLFHVAELDVLDVFDGDLGAELLLGFLQPVIARFHPALVGLGTWDQHADRERSGGAGRHRKAAQHHQTGCAGSARQKDATIELVHGYAPPPFGVNARPGEGNRRANARQVKPKRRGTCFPGTENHRDSKGR
jgi:hypothetical protein